jgi:hypothetical protein
MMADVVLTIGAKSTYQHYLLVGGTFQKNENNSSLFH